MDTEVFPRYLIRGELQVEKLGCGWGDEGK